jgi:catechol 2,3-dioxygenase-like lactoylglutathione lyase family enzyme
MRSPSPALLLFLTLALPAWSEPIATATGAFFALSVPDLDASTAWYTSKFGLTVTLQTKTEHVAVAVLEGNGLMVELIHRDGAVPADKASVHGIFKAGAIVIDFDATLARLKERKVEVAYGPYPAKPGQRANVIFKDNAGNLIQFFGPSGGPRK